VTNGYIATPFKDLTNNTNNWFNSGIFEARIKYPLKKFSWGAMWLFHGTQVNEIDISEAFGGHIYWPFIGFKGKKLPATEYNTYIYPPDPNPYNIKQSGEPGGFALKRKYPGQSWFNLVWGNGFRQDGWHVYKCLWDTASIEFYLDGQAIEKYWKYEHQVQRSLTFWEKFWGDTSPKHITVSSGCGPLSGNYDIKKGY